PETPPGIAGTHAVKDGERHPPTRMAPSLRRDASGAEVARYDHVPAVHAPRLEGAVEGVPPHFARGERDHVGVGDDAVVGAELVDDGGVADVPRPDRDRGSGD